MRLISQFDLSRLYTQEKVENIIKDYAQSYGLKLTTEKPNNINSNNININVNTNSINLGKPQILSTISNENVENSRFTNIIPSGNDPNINNNLDLNGKNNYLSTNFNIF